VLWRTSWVTIKVTETLQEAVAVEAAVVAEAPAAVGQVTQDLVTQHLAATAPTAQATLAALAMEDTAIITTTGPQWLL